ncbi:MAG: phosphatidylinositol phosphate synthase [Mycobacteriales bacterium]
MSQTGMVCDVLSELARGQVNRVLRPLAAGLARLGVTPNMVTLTGTIGVVVVCCTLVPRGYVFWSLWALVALTLLDLLDGAIARHTGRTSVWGAFLDSVCDRIADGAIFGSLAYLLATQHRYSAVAGAIACMATGAVVPYAKAKAESLGLRCDLGFAGRAERLILLGVAGLLVSAGIDVAFDVVVWTLTALATLTIAQRGFAVWKQARDLPVRTIS